jgi:hypothetical protein|nr:MAG TPA: cysteine-rich protein [Caudoviricetes sp.]
MDYTDRSGCIWILLFGQRVVRVMEQIKESWYYCPAGHKTGQRIEENSNIENTPIWCKHCKKAYYPVIKDGKIKQ